MRRVLSCSAIALAITLFAPSTAAHAGEVAFYGRLAAIGQGPQGTLKEGVELGAGVEYFLGPRFAIGAGFGYAREDQRDGWFAFEATSNVIETHGRVIFADSRVRPYAELGLGWYALRWRAEDVPFSGVSGKNDAPGGFVGGGAEAQVFPAVAFRAGVVYHAIANDIGLEGGDLSDYFTIGLTVMYRQ